MKTARICKCVLVAAVLLLAFGAGSVDAGSIDSSSFNGVTSGAISTAGTLDWGYLSSQENNGFFDSNLAGGGESYNNTPFDDIANDEGNNLTTVSGSSSIGTVTLTEGTTGTDTVTGQGNTSQFTFDGNTVYGSYGSLAAAEDDAWKMTFNDLGVGTFYITLFMGHSADNRSFRIDATLSDGITNPTAETDSGAISGLGSTVAAYSTSGKSFTYDITITTTSATDDLSLVFSSLSGSAGGAILAGYTVSGPPDLDAPIAGTLSPTNGAIDVGIASDFTISFNEDVAKGSGDILIRRVEGDTIFETIDVTDVTAVTVSTTNVTINPTSDLELGTNYWVEITNGVIQDLAGNPFAGITNAADWAFTTVAALPPPGVTTAGGATNIGVGTASLRAELTDGGSADVYICWGAEAGDGVSTSTWENVEYMGLINEGNIVTNDISGVLYGIEYSYRVYATNSEGSDWSNESSFYTDVPEPTSGSIKLDFSRDEGAFPGDAPLQSGWEGFSAVDGTSDVTHSYANSLASDGTLDVTISGMTHWRNYGEITAGDYLSLSDLLRDSVLRTSAGTMTLTISDLQAGDYNMTTYHHNTQYGGAGLTVTVSDSMVTDDEVFNESSTSNGQTPSTISTASFAVVSDGSDVLVKMTHQGQANQIKLNGFELDLVPSVPISITNTTYTNLAASSADLRGALNAKDSVFTIYAAYSESNNTSAAEWVADDTKTLVPDDTYTNVMGQAISVTVGSLTPETPYYYTLVASNAVTNIWATPSVSFNTLAAPAPPVVSTAGGATNIGVGTASLRADLSDGGSADVYICWGAEAGDDVSTSTWENVESMGTLSESETVTNDISGLLYGIEYSYRVYATNNLGTNWTSVATFSTLKPANILVANTTYTNVTDSSADLEGTLDATQSVFTVYAAYSESNNTSAAEWEADDTKTLILDAAYTNVMGQAISVTAGPLSPESTYYYTLVASNAVTNIWATPSVPFTTLAAAVAPGVTTNDGAFAIGYTTASLRGEQTAGGNADVYICWGTVASGGDTSSTSTWANVDFMGTLSDGDIVTNHLTGLDYSTAYHYMVYATNAADVAWSDIATFSTDTPGDNLYATGTFTWSTGVNAWSFESGGPYNQPWEAGKNAILEGSGTVTLGESVSLAHLKINNNYTYITGNTLAFEAGGTITNLGNAVHIMSGITGEPDVYVNQANGWGLGFGDNGFKLLPNSAAMAIGAIHRGVDNYFWLGGSVSTNTVIDNPYLGTIFDKMFVDGTGTWAVNKLYGGQPFQIKGGTLIANGELTARNMIELEGGVLHVNDQNALGSNSKPLYIEGGDLDNSSGAPVASAYNFTMRWSSDWTFVGSQGANSDLNLGTGAVTMYADRTVTVANAAATLTVGGVVSADAGNPYSLTKAGPGTLVLTGNNTYTGDTSVDGGVLSLSQPYLSSISSVRIADGATLHLAFNSTNDVFAVYTNGVAGPGGTWGAIDSGADNETDLIDGQGMLNVPQAEAVEGIRYWDGGTSDIGDDGNALSAGGSGTWNTSLKNWDAGAGVAHTNWNNAGTDLAFFKGAAGTVTVTESITLGALRIDNVDGYTIEGGTLNFTPGGSITNSSTSSGVNETKLTIASAITGAPDVQSALGPNTYVEFTPTAGSVELGALVGPGAYRFGGTADGSAASVSTKLRVSGSGTWTVSGDVNAYEHWAESGTLIVNGLLRGNNVGVHLSGGTIVVNGTTSGAGFDMTGGTIKGTGVISDDALVVPAAGTLAPGYPTGTLTITNNNCTIAGTLQIAINDALSPAAGRLVVDGALDISASTLSIDLTGTATAAAYIIAEYNSLVGTFTAFSGLPMGYTVDCSYEGDNVIALVGPQPSLFRFR